MRISGIEPSSVILNLNIEIPFHNWKNDILKLDHIQ